MPLILHGLDSPAPPGRLAAALAVVIAALAWVAPASAAPPHHARDAGAVELDQTSEFSHIRVRKRGDVRTLIFVRSGGEEVTESIVNLKRPYELQLPYTKHMFTTYLFKPKQERVLIVGLGGGAMVHFLTHHDPQLKIDAVEIDPAVVKVAADLFGVRAGGNVNIVTTDAFKFLAETETRYDVIYMDAFLKPSADTDSTGVPLKMKTVEFYKGLHKRLAPDGLMAFNLNPHPKLEEDLGAIRAAFPQVYVFRVADTNVVAIATLEPKRATAAALKSAAHEADLRLKTGFSFQQLLANLVR